MCALPNRAARRKAALPALVVPVALLLAGCGTSPAKPPAHHGNGAGAVPTASAAATPVVVSTPAALSDALRATEKITSYRFTVQETIAGSRSVPTRVVGEVVTGKGVSYQLTVGSQHSQVVRLPGVTYVRTLPGRWSRIAPSGNAVDPSSTLLGVLRSLRPVAVSAGAHGQRTVRGELAATAAVALGLPAENRPVPVSVTMDEAGHVVSLAVRAVSSDNGRQVTVLVHTTYGAFDQAKAIAPPT